MLLGFACPRECGRRGRSAAGAPPSQSARGTRRRPKNSGGGIAPAAIGALIEGGLASVNAFAALSRLSEAPAVQLNCLKRLNIRSHPIIARSGAARTAQE